MNSPPSRRRVETIEQDFGWEERQRRQEGAELRHPLGQRPEVELRLAENRREVLLVEEYSAFRDP